MWIIFRKHLRSNIDFTDSKTIQQLVQKMVEECSSRRAWYLVLEDRCIKEDAANVAATEGYGHE